LTGGFRKGMELAGHECIGFCEIDKHAHNAYKVVHDTEGEWEAYDITRVSDDDIRSLGRERGPIQAICGGFPCQAFSVAGKRGGFDDTRGTLFFEIMRFASILRPRTLFLENVVGLLSHEGGATFETILRTLDEVGYDAEWNVLNSKDYGVPQNRERVFIIGHLRGERTRKVFPLREQNEGTIKVVGKLEGKFRSRNDVLSPDGVSTCLDTMQGGGHEPKVLVMGNTNPSGNGMKGQVFDAEGLAPTITTNKGEGNKILVRPILTPDREEKRQNGRRMKEPDEPMFTLTAQDRHGIAIKKVGHLESDTGGTGAIYSPSGLAPTQLAQHGNAVTKIACINPRKEDGTQTYQQDRVYETDGQMVALTSQLAGRFNIKDQYRIRKLTPLECMRLQGFPDEWYYKLKEAKVSDSQLYKMAGNAVTVNVIYEIARRL
jgi:DNA (cytosine-5)-methyltransferase 1